MIPRVRGERAPHERYQGLYFRYGSLFALGGDASTPEVTFNPTSEYMILEISLMLLMK